MESPGYSLLDALQGICYNVTHETEESIQVRIYPTDEQKHILARTFGCVRFVYNWALRQKTDAYYKEQKRLYYKDLSDALTH